jgi:hypothetical protein
MLMLYKFHVSCSIKMCESLIQKYNIICLFMPLNKVAFKMTEIEFNLFNSWNIDKRK